MNAYILAHDLGTSGNKATLCHTDSRLVTSRLTGYPISCPREGWAKQNPWGWWEAVCHSIKELLTKTDVDTGETATVPFNTQMMGCLLTDGEGAPQRPMTIWAGTRASKGKVWTIERIGMECGYRVTGYRPSASYSAAKLSWVRNHEPEVYRRSRWVPHAKDFVAYRFIKQFVTGYGDTSSTSLFSIKRRCWSGKILQILGVNGDLLPVPRPSINLAGTMTKKAAGAIRLREGTSVTISGGDGGCTCVEIGVVEQRSAYHVLGFSSWIVMVDRSPYLGPKIRTSNWAHLDPPLCTPRRTMRAARYSHRWYEDTVYGQEAYNAINEGILLVKSEAGELLYLPYLLGERSPHWNHSARGAFVGLSVTTVKKGMSKAVLESVGCNLKAILESLKRAGAVRELMTVGDGARGGARLQILVGVFQMPLKLLAYLEKATSLGTAVCAGIGVGIYPNLSVVKKVNQIGRTVMPDENLAERYGRLC